MLLNEKNAFKAKKLKGNNNMEWIIIVISLITIILLKIGLNVHFNDIKKIKSIGTDKKLKEIADKFPSNREICEEILKKLDNKDIKIEESPDTKSSFYIVMGNKIIIANIKDTFTRIQTIAHECLHSIQNRRILLFNFIFSNIYLLFFILSIILIVFNIGNNLVYIHIYVGLSIIYFAVRMYLENEAMSKAIYVAKDYMQDYKSLHEEISNKDIETLLKNFDEMNKIGIPLTNFYLAFGIMVKIIILAILAILF